MLVMIDRNMFESKPKEICVECTTLCNCKCAFCYNQNSFARNKREKMELSTDQFKILIDRAVEAKIDRIRFTGGEPLFRKDIFELALYAKNKGMKTVLNTNGLLIDKEVGRKVVDLFDICLISFFTCNPQYLEAITRVKGAYQLKLDALENIRGCERIWCSTIIGDPSLADDLEAMAAIMDDYGVHNWFLLRTNPVEQNKLPHTFEEIEKIIDSILMLHKKTGRLVNIGNPIPLCAYKPLDLQHILSDGVLYAEGRSKMVIDPLGNIVIDYCLRDKIGNALSDDLIKCWKSEKLNLIRGNALLPDICKKCKFLDKCCGGSRFASKIVNGEFGQLDPLARPDRYKEILFG